jgi:hypothetical protein
MSPTKRKRCHKVTASSDEQDDAWRPGARVNVRPREHTKIKRKVKVQEGKECTAKMSGARVNIRPRAHTKSNRKVKVQEENDCTAKMGKYAEATPVELTQAYVFDLKHCSP